MSSRLVTIGIVFSALAAGPAHCQTSPPVEPAAVGAAPPAATAAATTPASVPASAPATGEAPGPLKVEYIFKTGCAECAKVKPLVDEMEKKYGKRIRVIRYNQSEDEGIFAAAACDARHGREKEGSAPPSVYVGPEYLEKREVIEAQLEAAIERQLAIGAREPQGRDISGKKVLEARFESITIGAVMLAGLIDGINPCAFTTIIFFLSMLAYLKRSRREMILVSVSFTLAVFLTYLMIGVGMFAVVKAFSVNQGISRGISYAIAAFTFVLGAWSFFDAIRFARGGKAPKMSLGLPSPIKKMIHNVIRSGLKAPSLVIGAATVGFLVSVLESLCTGQVYLPTITFMIKATEHLVGAAAYLVLYNIMFIIPLIVLTILSYWGVSSERLGKFMGKRVALSKVALGVLFTGLGVLLLVTA
jgi:cytochrome c biogenesis protein CcdA